MNRSPGRKPVPYSAATISVTIERCVCFTASGSSRVVPDVYWKMARESAAVSGAKFGANRSSSVRKASSATTTRGPIPVSSGAFSVFVTSRRGVQSLTRSFTPSGPNSVNSGTAMAPSFMVPNTAM